VPATHGVHTVLEVELHAEATYFPAPQVEQVRELLDPAGQYPAHGRRLDALGQYEPAGHSVFDVDPAGQ
jgi:hypothetical protein